MNYFILCSMSHLFFYILRVSIYLNIKNIEIIKTIDIIINIKILSSRKKPYILATFIYIMVLINTINPNIPSIVLVFVFFIK